MQYFSAYKTQLFLGPLFSIRMHNILNHLYNAEPSRKRTKLTKAEQDDIDNFEITPPPSPDETQLILSRRNQKHPVKTSLPRPDIQDEDHRQCQLSDWFLTSDMFFVYSWVLYISYLTFSAIFIKFSPTVLKVVGRGSETQLQVGENHLYGRTSL